MKRLLPSLILAMLLLVVNMPVLNATSESGSGVKVGLYYYVWYGEVYGGRHWNNTPPDGDNILLWNVVDTPLLGYYSSQSAIVIKQHLEWFVELGIDFIIISWWGPHSYEDNSIQAVFSMVQQNSYPLQIAIMVEAYNHSGAYNFEEIYDYIRSNYASQFPGIYMKLDFKPLVCFYNDENMTGTEDHRYSINHADDRFTSRIVGHSSYVDWWFAIPCSVINSTTPSPSNKDKMICVEPRYDNYFINQTPLARFDTDLKGGLYSEQWAEAMGLARTGKVTYVTIYSWNEYHERSQIEPHYTNGNLVLSLFAQTRSYIDQIKSLEEPASTSPVFMIIGVVIGAVLTWLFLRYRTKESYIKERAATVPPQKGPRHKEIDEERDEETDSVRVEEPQHD